MKIKVAYLTTQDSQGNPQIGDCIVITFPEKSKDGATACVVIDGGYTSTKKVLSDYLFDENIREIDLIVATHIDNDHISGLNGFLEDYVVTGEAGNLKRFNIRNYWGPARQGYEPMSIAEFASFIPDVDDLGLEELSFISQSVKANEKLYNNISRFLDDDHIWHPSVNNKMFIPQIFGSVKIEILGPDKQIPDVDIKGTGEAEVSMGNYLLHDLVIDLSDKNLKIMADEAALEKNRNANNQSIVFRLTSLDENGHEIENCKFLFTGDAEEESWEVIMEGIEPEESLESIILKAAHHGSRTGTTKKILEKVKPKYYIVCAGNNTHGLPDNDVLKMVDNESIKIFCTGRNTKVGEKKTSPCIKNEILNACTRWDEEANTAIKDHLIFEMDQRHNLSLPTNHCKFSWKRE